MVLDIWITVVEAGIETSSVVTGSLTEAALVFMLRAATEEDLDLVVVGVELDDTADEDLYASKRQTDQET